MGRRGHDDVAIGHRQAKRRIVSAPSSSGEIDLRPGVKLVVRAVVNVRVAAHESGGKAHASTAFDEQHRKIPTCAGLETQRGVRISGRPFLPVLDGVIPVDLIGQHRGKSIASLLGFLSGSQRQCPHTWRYLLPRRMAVPGQPVVPVRWIGVGQRTDGTVYQKVEWIRPECLDC